MSIALRGIGKQFGEFAAVENIDLDVRVGDVDEPHLVAHRIADSSRILCAAPSYLERRGIPVSVAELSKHD